MSFFDMAKLQYLPFYLSYLNNLDGRNPKQPPGMVLDGINYQPQLVQDSWTINSTKNSHQKIPYFIWEWYEGYITHRFTIVGLPEEIPPNVKAPNLPRPEIEDFQKPPLREVVHLGGNSNQRWEVFPPFFLGGFSHGDFFRKKKKHHVIFEMMENFNHVRWDFKMMENQPCYMLVGKVPKSPNLVDFSTC